MIKNDAEKIIVTTNIALINIEDVYLNNLKGI
jgi:hypothetical protein